MDDLWQTLQPGSFTDKDVNALRYSSVRDLLLQQSGLKVKGALISLKRLERDSLFCRVSHRLYHGSSSEKEVDNHDYDLPMVGKLLIVVIGVQGDNFAKLMEIYFVQIQNYDRC